MSDDNFYIIDRLTGAATLLGSTGLSLSYGQDISWDSNTSTLFGMLYDETQGGIFGTFDTGTGAFNTISVPGDQIAAFAVNNTWTGISETGNDIPLFYPNPAADYLYVNTGYPASISIFDICGRQVLFTEMNELKPVSLKSIDPGTYYVQIVSDGNIFGSLLIKQ
ncbi:hypothetical protein DSECCO2_657150 [anaerobic digester metagenome]